MISCKIVENIHASERSLTTLEKFQYKLHLFICKNCQKIKSQYEMINKRVKNLPDPKLTQKDQDKIDDILKSIK